MATIEWASSIVDCYLVLVALTAIFIPIRVYFQQFLYKYFSTLKSLDLNTMTFIIIDELVDSRRNLQYEILFVRLFELFNVYLNDPSQVRKAVSELLAKDKKIANETADNVLIGLQRFSNDPSAYVNRFLSDSLRRRGKSKMRVNHYLKITIFYIQIAALHFLNAKNFARELRPLFLRKSMTNAPGDVQNRAAA